MSNATTARQRTETDWPQENALLTLEVVVSETWIDYNDHMTEWQYYKVLSDACENFLTAIGSTEAYRGRGFSFFSVEGHLRNLRECRLGTALKVYTEVIAADSFRLHIYQYIVDVGRHIVVATGEHMLLHIDMTTRKPVRTGPYMQDCMQEAASRWKAPLLPKGANPSFRTLSAAVGGSSADVKPVIC